MKKSYPYLSLILFLSTSLLSGCALIFTGATQTVRFVTDENAKVYQNLAEIGRTNQDIKIKCSDLNKLYIIKAEGCLDKYVELPISTNNLVYLDACLGLPLLNIPIAFSYYYDADKKTDEKIYVTLDCSQKK